jgi:hypothetical protein
MSALLALMLVQSDSYGSGGMGAAFGLVFFLVWLAIVVLMIASVWVVFTKAGEPGWAVLIPIYNAIVFLRVAGKPWWWLLLFLIPFVNIVLAFIVAIAIAKNFGKGAGFGIGLALLGFIFYPILAWSDAQYQPQ